MAGKKVFLTLLEMNFKEFYRDFGSVFFSFAFPLFFVLLLVAQEFMSPGAMTFKLGILEEGKNTDTEWLLSLLEANETTRIVRVASFEEGGTDLKDGKIHALLSIPAGNLTDGHAGLKLYCSPSFAPFAKVMMDAARGDLAQQEWGHDTPFTYQVAEPPGGTLSQFSFIFPGMMAMALLQLGLFGTAMPMLRARDRGTLQHLGLTSLSPALLLTSQVSLRLIICMFQVALLLAVGTMKTGFPVSSLPALLLISLLGSVLLISMGFALAGISTSLESGSTMIMFVNFGMLFGGNVFFDLTNSPILKYIGYALPITYVGDMYRQVISGVSGIFPFWTDAAVILLWIVIVLLIAVKSFRFEMKKN